VVEIEWIYSGMRLENSNREKWARDYKE